MINIKGKTIYGPNVVTSGLVLYLDAANTRSYPGTGTTWFDLSGKNNHVSAVNGPTWNSSGYFANDADSYFSGAGTSTIPTGNSPYTMLVWARQGSTYGWGSNFGFISIGGYTVVNGSNALRTDGQLGYFHHYWWSNDLSLSNNNAGLALNRWFMVAASFDGTTRRIWVNGVSMVSDTPTGHNVTSTEIQISKTYGTEYQRGDIAIAAVYNKGLSSDEMLSNYNAFKKRFSL
jgi:hypothetical protein